MIPAAGRIAAIAVAGSLLAPGAASARPSAVLALVPAPHAGSARRDSAAVLAQLARQPSLALGLVSATQGRFSDEQALLDLSQGTRAPSGAYSPETPPHLRLATGREAGWAAVVRRARTVHLPIEPGLLGASVPDGVAYVGVDRAGTAGAIAAADRTGAIAAVSVGDAASFDARLAATLDRHPLVVVGLPPGGPGARLLAGILARRTGGELVIALQAPPPATHRGQLLALGIAGLGYAGELTSATTRQPGLVAMTDLAPTALRFLGLEVPRAMRGQVVHAGDRRDPGNLNDLAVRLRQIGPRRTRILGLLALGWLALALAVWPLGRQARRRALRGGALGLLWAPGLALVPAALPPPSFAVEAAIVVGGSLLAGVLTDALVRWPRGPLVPAAAIALAYALDLADHSHLLVRSLIGPHPFSGARFYGIGNEFRSGLAVLVLAGLAAAAGERGRSRSLAAVFACAGGALAILLGSGRLGAVVGGVIIVTTATAVATVLLLPGGPSKRAVALAVVAPAAAVAALAGLDLLTAGGNGHLSHDVLGVDAAANLRDAILRRYGLAAQALAQPRMLAATVLCALVVAGAWLRRARLAPLLPSPGWQAALAGGLAGGVAGALTEDSGPLLFVVAVAVLGVVSAYVAARPQTT